MFIFAFSMDTAILLYDPVGGVPEGGVPDGGVPKGRVPFTCILSGGGPEGRVPFICIPPGGVPFDPADWLNCGFSPVLASPGVADATIVPEPASGVFSTVCACPAALVESWVQPATRIPAMRNADAISIIILLFFI